MSFSRPTAAILCALLLTPAAVRAEESGSTESVLPALCLQQVEDAMGSALREYRGVVLGVPKAAKAPVGTLRYAKDRSSWLKTDNGSWRSLTKGYEGTTWGDSLMDSQAEFPPRRGWMEVRMASTSELLPPLLQSMRALQCKLENVCGALSASVNGPEGSTAKVTIDGCLPEDIPVFSECTPKADEAITQSAAGEISQTCERMRQTVIGRERELLKLLVAYDAAHRSLRQFLGVLETFTVDIRSTLLGPLWQAVRIFHALGRSPCFSSQCEQ